MQAPWAVICMLMSVCKPPCNSESFGSLQCCGQTPNSRASRICSCGCLSCTLPFHRLLHSAKEIAESEDIKIDSYI